MLVLAVSLLVGGVAAAANSGMVSVHPARLHLHSLQVATATTYIDVDLPASGPSLVHANGIPPDDEQTAINRAEYLGRILITSPVLSRMARRCGLPAAQVTGYAWTTTDVPFVFTEPDSEQRAAEIAASQQPYQIQVEPRPDVPIVDVYSEAPSVAAANCLGNAAPIALRGFLQSLARNQHDQDPISQIRTLGPAQAVIVNTGANIEIAFLTFVTFFGLTLATAATIRRWRRRRANGEEGAAVPVLDDLDDVLAEPLTPRRRLDSWPHTKRWMPWALAVFLVVIWLTPFNDISLNVNLPIELRLDRLVLIVVALVWLLALAAGGRAQPVLRMSPMHVAIAGLLAAAFLSVVTDARYLNQVLEFSLSLKKLPLLVAYVSLFLFISSSLKRSEINAFLTLTLGLAVVCALGMLYEYHFRDHIFWDLTRDVLPGFMHLTAPAIQASVDTMGRRVVIGPTEDPLEAVAMLTMALPIALVRLVQAPRWSSRLFYSVLTCLIFAACLATNRKTALVAPVAVIVVVAYLRRRDFIRIVPLVLVLVLVVTVLAPGALSAVVDQFTRSNAAAVPTVSDRTAGYDAIRPDVWTHIVFGRGWGSYDHSTNRILDSQALDLLIETGVVGIVAYMLVPLTAFFVSRKAASSRDPVIGTTSVIVAAAAIGFLILTFLFDLMSFPHPVYGFLSLAGLEAVALRKPERAGIGWVNGLDETQEPKTKARENRREAQTPVALRS